MKALLLVTIISLSSLSFGQMFNFGIRFGAQSEAVDLHENFSFKNPNFSYGYSLGALTRFKFGFIAVQPEITWNQAFNTFTFDDGSTSSTSQATFSRVDIPVWINFYIFRFWRLGIAPLYSFRFEKFENSGTYWQEFQNNFNNGNFALAFGTGFEIWRFLIDFDYRLGLGNYTSSISTSNGTVDFSTLPHTLSLTLAFKFRHKKD